MKRKACMMFMVLMAVSLFGCTHLNLNLTPEAKYLTALEWYNTNLELYLTHYRGQTPEVKAEWAEKYHPIFRAGDIALATYRVGLPQGEAKWMEAKREILATLLALEIVEVQ